ncbi:MAG: hypothetical protein WBH04_01740 [Albidovulum sp.]
MSKKRVEYLRAYLPYCDAVGAMFSMRGSDYSVDWRHNYIVALSTLRATGHVLHKVDTLRFPELGPVVTDRFARWKKGEGDDALFKHFIEDGRNQLLKTYLFTANDELAFFEDELESGDIDIITEGFFKGYNVVDILHHCANWWATELSEIADEIGEHSIVRLGAMA